VHRFLKQSISIIANCKQHQSIYRVRARSYRDRDKSSPSDTLDGCSRLRYLSQLQSLSALRHALGSEPSSGTFAQNGLFGVDRNFGRPPLVPRRSAALEQRIALELPTSSARLLIALSFPRLELGLALCLDN